jgi:protein-L-isoaspartate(D-aspartate) O-methyltransferase
MNSPTRDPEAMRTNPTRDAEERAQFLLRMRAKGIGDLRILRAMELMPRALFMPQRYADIAARDIALPIGCGQTSPPPSTLAAMIEALDLRETSRVLEIGAGSGYSAALIGQIAGQIFSFERCQTLATEAASRLQAFGLGSIVVKFADGLALGRIGPFDRILVHALIEPPGEHFTRLLAPGGVLIAGVAGETRGDQRILRLSKSADGLVNAQALGPLRTLMPLVDGLARAL